MTNKKVGVYAGTFDPVHEGHVAFAEQALTQCGLAKVFFLVEPRPRRKQGVRAVIHRQEMVRLTIEKQDKFGMIQLEQANFTVEQTLPTLQALFKGADIHLLLGEDVFVHLNAWPHIEQLLTACQFVIGIRKDNKKHMQQTLQTLQKTRSIKLRTTFITTQHHDISSTIIRRSLKHGQQPAGLLPETAEYIREHKLYVSEE